MRKLNIALLLMLLVWYPNDAVGQTEKAKPFKGPVKVFILAGQSNMEGKARVELLKHQMMQPETKDLFAHLHKDGELIERDDVFIKFLERSGKLTAGFGSKDRIGPELQFGFTVGDHFDEPVLLIKTAWGGKSLYRDFRSPSGGEADQTILQKQLENAQKKKPETTMADIKAGYGHFYREMMKEIDSTLENIDEFVPGYEDQGYEIEGFAWFQGFNDMINPDYVAAYTDLMAHFIRDVRKDLDQPNLPFAIGVLGVGGTKEKKKNERKEEFKRNQAAVGDMEEFKGNVGVVHTDRLWDDEAQAVFDKGWKEHFEEWQKIGSDRPYHYLGSVKCYNRIGGALAESLLEVSGETKSKKKKISAGSNFAKENLVAWCIVPFDAKQRGPAARATMVRELGLKRVAYDWRKKHLPEFEQEILEYKKNDIEYFAFWNWHDSMAPLVKKHGIAPQVWQNYRGGEPQGTEQERIDQMIQQLGPVAKVVKELGLKFGIYNHGGWQGEPASMVEFCKQMRERHGCNNVGIVYNFHHGHDHIDGFADKFKLMQPYLMCVNINGMVEPEAVDPKTRENKILPVGSGKFESEMIQVLIESQYDGPIGVLGHRAEMDAKEAVQLNLDGLATIVSTGNE